VEKQRGRGCEGLASSQIRRVSVVIWPPLTRSTAQRPSFAYQVDSAIETASVLPISSLEAGPDAPEDSDSWLEVSPDELDGMMMKASGKEQRTERPVDKVDLGDEHGQALQDLAAKVQQFVGGQGDVEGARFEE
jgi:hypothetical protein